MKSKRSLIIVSILLLVIALSVLAYMKRKTLIEKISRFTAKKMSQSEWEKIAPTETIMGFVVKENGQMFLKNSEKKYPMVISKEAKIYKNNNGSIETKGLNDIKTGFKIRAKINTTDFSIIDLEILQ